MRDKLASDDEAEMACKSHICKLSPVLSEQNDCSVRLAKFAHASVRIKVSQGYVCTDRSR